MGLSARLAKQAAADLAEVGRVAVAEIEELWHALHAPYADLFAWLEGRAERPTTEAPGRFRPVMLAQAIDEATDFARLDPADYAAEWKWDGIRVQAVHEGGVRRLYTRTGDELSKTFPDVVDALRGGGRDRRRTPGAARRPGGELRRPAAAVEPQERRRQAPGGLSGRRPGLRPPGRGRGGHPCPALRRAPQAPGGLRGEGGQRPHRSFADAALRRLAGPCGPARRSPARATRNPPRG